jgi:hypothetical protein
MQSRLKQIILIIFSSLLMTACSTIESRAISPDIDLFDWENDGVIVMGTVSAGDNPVTANELKKSTNLYETALAGRLSNAILATGNKVRLLTADQAREKLGEGLYQRLLKRYKHAGKFSSYELSEIKEKLPDTRFVMAMYITKNTISHTTTKDPVNEDNKKRITTHSVRIVMNIFDTKTGKEVYRVTSINSADKTHTMHNSSNFLGEVLDVALLDRNGYPEPEPTSLIVNTMVNEDVSDLYRSLQKNL